MRQTASILLSFAIGLGIIGIILGEIRWWETAGFILSPASWRTLAALLPLSAAIIWFKRHEVLKSVPAVEGFGLALIFLFFSDWLTRGYNFFQGPSIRGEILFFSAITLLLLKIKRLNSAIQLVLPLAIALLIGALLVTAAGRIIHSDDHATFLYRLSLLRDTFPKIPFYSPLWNAGNDVRDFFATGALNLFFLTLPLIYLGNLAANYNFIVISIIFLLLPASVYLAATKLKLERTAAQLAALLSLSTGLVWYRWALKYGTMGFITSAALMPLNLALTAKLLDKDEDLSAAEAILLVLTFSLMLCWTPSGLVFIPAGIIAVFRIRQLISKRLVIKVALAILIINLPWLTVFWSVSNVSKFIVAEKAVHSQEIITSDSSTSSHNSDFKHRAGSIHFGKSLKIIRETAISTNPLLIILALPGILLLRRSYQLLFGATAAWLFITGSLLPPLKPQLELDRMLLILSLLCCIPAAQAIKELFSQASSSQHCARLVFASLAGGFLFTGPLASAAIIRNRTVEHYYFATQDVVNITNAIRSYAGGGRVLFSGFVLHELNGGHLAPLVYSTGKPLIASSHMHNLWKYKQVFPTAYLANQNHGGIEQYLDLYNVSAVFAHEHDWKVYFSARPEIYDLVWESGGFQLYRRLNFESNYFSEGFGEILEQNPNSVKLKVGTSKAVLKFNYFPFLRSSACRISGKPYPGDLQLIELTECQPGAEVLIDSKPVWQRIFG